MADLDEEEASCANPELLSFLKEWLRGARGTKAASTYNQAYLSMKACPVTFHHPMQAIDLKGIGPRLVERLTQRMEEWCMENNQPMPEVPNRSARKRRVVNANIDNINVDDADPQPPAPNPKRPRRTQKEYVPTYRSGAYGILIALLEAGDDMLTKQQVIELAQPHADASYIAPPHVTNFYTAWSSMKTLIEKNLVYTRGTPPRFWLTETGEEVARAIQAGREPITYVPGGGGGNGEGSGSGPRPPPRAPAGVASAANPPPENQPPRGPGGLHASRDGYMQDSRRIAAEVEGDKQIFRRHPGLGEGATGNRPQVPSFERLVGYAVEPRPTLKQEKKPSPELMDLEDITNFPPPSRSPALGVIDRNLNIQSFPHLLWGSSSLNVPSTPHPILREVPSFQNAREASALHQHAQPKPAPTRPQPRQCDPQIFPPFTPEVLIAGTFTVHLLIDNREKRAFNDREYISTNLSNAGANPIVRNLKVGDAMWVARENAAPHREVVLDYIVERKRLDDLIFSVKDGRYQDQKFRLKKSGVKNVTYIIEDLTVGALDGHTLEMLETAISSTQVVDGFFVKRTSKLDDTILYLVRMTKMLQRLYQTQDLYLIPDPLVEYGTYTQLLNHLSRAFPTKRFYITYDVFSMLAAKSGSLTLRDLFLKFLMVVRGITIEKACEIQRCFPTPRALVEAYGRCADDEEKMDLLRKTCAEAVGRRKVGRALSEKVAEVWAGVGDGYVHHDPGEEYT